MSINNITTGEQTITTTGPITGTLSTATLTTDFTITIRARGLNVGESMLLVIEDTASSSAFSDAEQVLAPINIVGGQPSTEGYTVNVRAYQVPTMRIGATNNKVRINCLALNSTGSPSVQVFAWMST
jgi:hypothetical protein